MRVVIVAEVFLPKIDGVVNRTLHLIRQLVQSGDEVLIICPEAPGCDKCSVPVVSFRSFSFLFYPEYRIGLPDDRLAKAIQEFKPEVLHFINPFAFGFRCYDLLQRQGIRLPCVFSFHTLYGEFAKQYRLLRPLSLLIWWLMKEYHNSADMNMTVSSGMQQDLTQRGFQRVQYWPPAVDSDLFRPAARSVEMRARLTKGRPEKKLLLTVSRLAPEKSVGFLADVLAQLPDTCLAIIGDGPQRAELEQRFAPLDAHFLGYLQGDELAAAYASSDAFVYASETETMGNVVLEAMACGCTVIAPRAGGIPSLITHAETGLLFQPGNLEEATRYTRQALACDPICTTLGTQARLWVENRGWSASIRQVREVYQQAIDHFRSTPDGVKQRHRLARLVVSVLVTVFKAVARE